VVPMSTVPKAIADTDLRGLWLSVRCSPRQTPKISQQPSNSMFKTDRSLINSKFEGYKLDPIEQAEHVFSYPLPCQVSQATVSTSTRTGSTHLPFEEMRSRIRHNYLSMGRNGEALYIDEDMGVNIIRIQGQAYPSSLLREMSE
jgi:hypothetical protein